MAVVNGRGVVIVLAAAFFISLTNVLAPIIYDSGSNPLTYLTVRFLFFVLVCRLWFVLRGISTALPQRLRYTAYGIGIIYTIGAGSILVAIAYIPVSMAVLILYLYPLLTMMVTCALDRRHPRAIEVICLLIAFMGLALALGVSFDNLHPTGLVLSGIAALAITTFVVWSGRSLGEVDNAIALYHMAVSATVASGLATLIGGSYVLTIASVSCWLIFCGAVVSFTIAFFAIFSGVKIAGPIRFAMIMNTEPIITIALSFMILSESMTLQQFVGAAMVIGAVAVAQRFGGDVVSA